MSGKIEAMSSKSFKQKGKTARPLSYQLKKNNRLGQGLDALLGPEPASSAFWLDIEKIYPNKEQPRKAFDKKKLEELSLSVKTKGLLQPILVQKQGEKYQIIAGERRWRAAGLAGLRKIPAIVKKTHPHQAPLLALIENILREDLNPIDEARAFKKILSENFLTQEELAKNLGRSRPSVANSLRLLQLDKEVQLLIEEKQISFAQARELLRFKSAKDQREWARKAAKGSLTVKKISSKAGSLKLPFWAKKALSHLERRFSQKLSLSYFKGKGRLAFSFQNERELKDLLDRLWSK